MILLIGYGNPLRRDDGAGRVLARRLNRALKARGIDVDLIISHQLTPEMAEDIAEPDVSAAIFIDASVSSEKKPTITPISEAVSTSKLGHHLVPEVLMAYAHVLYNRQPPAWTVALPGFDFEHGKGLSADTKQAVKEAECLLLNLIAKDIRIEKKKAVSESRAGDLYAQPD